MKQLLKKYLVEVDETSTHPCDFGIEVSTYVVLATSEEEAEEKAKTLYSDGSEEKEFNILNCKCIDGLKEGLLFNISYYE